MNKGKEFEKLIATVEEAVHNLPGVQVLHDVKLPTKYGGERQIDILILEDRGRFTYKTIIECKNTQSKVTVNTVGGFKELVESVGAHQGIIVSASGFQKGALLSTKDTNIFLYQLSQTSELEEHLKNFRFNIYQVTHTSKDFTVKFKERKEINDKITIYEKMFSSVLNKSVSIVEITEDFLAKARPGITDALIRKVTEPEKVQIIMGATEIKVDFPLPLIFESNNEVTEVTGFETVLATEFFTSPTSVTNVSEYKDIIESKTHALIIEVEFGGEKFNLLRKEI